MEKKEIINGLVQEVLVPAAKIAITGVGKLIVVTGHKEIDKINAKYHS